MRETQRDSLLIIPLFLYLTSLTIFPIIYLVYMGFLDWNLAIGSPKFIGFENYLDLLTEEAGHPSYFFTTIGVTIVWAISVTAIELLIGIGVALLLNRETRLAKSVQILLIIPLMMTPLLVFMVWQYIYMPGLGPLTYFANLLGVMEPHFLDVVPNVWFSFLLVDIWQNIPFVALVALAGLSAIPKAPLEAAEIDGAGGWRKFRHIVIPLLRPILTVVILFRLVDALKTFDIVWALTKGGPGRATQTASFFIYYYGLGFTLEVGRSAANGLIFLIVVMGIAAILMIIVYRTVQLGGYVKG